LSTQRTTFKKTIVLSGIAAGATVAVALLADSLTSLNGVLIAVVALIASVPLWLTVVAGLVVLNRDARMSGGRRDLFLAVNRTRTEAAVDGLSGGFGLPLRRLFRALFAPRRLVVGDEVRVRSFEEIRSTLDAQGCLNGLPFLPEMVSFCGKSARVFRRIDKVYDYGGKKDLRRLQDTVLLSHVRCDGHAHGGCQAACYLMWKEAWLEPVKSQSTVKTADPARADIAALGAQTANDSVGVTRYRCQFTQLVSASTPLSTRDPRGDLRPLLAGNVTLLGFGVVMLTRWFNWVQSLRGGGAFPAKPEPMNADLTVLKPFVPGDFVTVRRGEHIATTLDKKNKNRGLWFDKDMLKHCGFSYPVLRRVDRIIDDATGQMREMKTPCIVLDNVNYSGEGLRFCAQEENLYWREAWLAPAAQGEVRKD
jgi:hypothetical protein